MDTNGDTPIDLIWDMETDDPDDFLTLLLLLGHPLVRLRAVTIVPGSPLQVGLVRAALGWFGLDIPVGVFNLHTDRPALSPWHERAYGPISPSMNAEPAAEVLVAVATPTTTLLAGGPLRNLQAAIQHAAAQQRPFVLPRVVIQGGFAGEGVVPTERQLPKFRGERTAVSHNLSKHPKSALTALAYTGFQTRYLVAKNVCHRVVYDAAMHQEVGAHSGDSLALRQIWRGMELYLQELPQGKLLHDPLAACCAIDPAIGTWVEVEVYQEQGRWGSRPAPGSNTWIITDYDPERFAQTFFLTR